MEWVEAWVGVWACLFRMCWEGRRGEKGRWLTPPPPQTHPPKPLDPMAENHCQLSWNAYPCLHQSKQGLLVNKEPDWATAVLVRSYFKELTATNRMWSWGSRRRFMLHLSLSVAKTSYVSTTTCRHDRFRCLKHVESFLHHATSPCSLLFPPSTSITA